MVPSLWTISKKVLIAMVLASAALTQTTAVFAQGESRSGSSRLMIRGAGSSSPRHSAASINMPAIGRRAAPSPAYRSWLPKRGNPRLVLLCIHALGFSSKSYDNFGRRMAASGIPTYALDVRGFGAWIKQPDKAHMDFKACFTDVEQGLKALRQKYPRLPIFLVGESMGGAIAIQAAARYPDLVNGLVAAVPSSEDRGSMRSGMVVAYKTAENPGSNVDMAPVIVDGATNDPALRRKINAEPLNRMELSKKELAQFERFMKETHDAAPLIERIPALMLVAYKDKLVTAAGSVDLFSEMTTSQKLMIGDGNSQHLMLEEAQMTPEICRILTGWLQDKAGQGTGNRGLGSK